MVTARTLNFLCKNPFIHDTSTFRNLTWHNGAIPSDEIWIKLGGDKGRGSFKLNMQVVNIPHPNSIRNTSLVAVFKAGDRTVNLHTAGAA